MRKYTVVIILFLLTISGAAQISQDDSLHSFPLHRNVAISGTDDDYSKRQISRMTPVSPNAASLGIYGAIPVGHYTGIPSISIPIYEISLDGKVIPITLSYHASGIKVSQEASSIGLGWALNAGGCIVREIRGRDDFASSMPPKSYYYDTEFPHWNSNNDADPTYFYQEVDKYKSYLNSGGDSEPDLFHFNFGSFTGTLLFNKVNTPGNSPAMAKGIIRKETEYLDVTLETSPYNLKFTIKDGDGFTYYFRPYELSTTYTANNSDYNPNIQKNAFTQKMFDQEYTGWYLDSIVSPNNNKISFSYSVETIVTPISISEDVSYMVSRGGIGYQFRGSYMYYNYAYSESKQARLTKIIFDGGYVSFGYSDRLDLESLNSEKAKKLSSITVHSNNNEIVKRLDLQQSYMGGTNSPLTCRLMLDSIKINDHTNKPTSYAFSYNGGVLPSKESPSCDYWGYYNGSTPAYGEQTFKLSPTIYLQDENKVLAFNGLNKRSDPGLSQYGILKEIRYPTGGKTVFDYDLHDFQGSIQEFKKTEVSYTSLTIGELNNWNATGQRFEIKEKTKVDMEMMYWHTMPPSGYDYPYVEIHLYKEGSTEGPKRYYMRASASSYPDPERSREGSDSQVQSLVISEGTYYFVVFGPWMSGQGRDNQVVRITMSGIGVQEVKQGGGPRIKSITSYSDDGKVSRKIFNYSRGVLMTPPRHHSQYVLTNTEYHIMPTAVFVNTYSAGYLNGYSTPYTPFSNSAQGGYVGYSQVEEKNIDIGNENSDNGSEIYTFINIPDDALNLTDRMIKGFPAISHQENGMLLEIAHLDKDKQFLKKKIFEYSAKQERNKIKGLKTFRIPMFTGENDQIDIKYYDIVGERWHLIRTREFEYSPNGADSVTTTTEYGYNNTNLLANYEKVTGSKSNIVERLTQYPADINSTITNEMVGRHMVNMPIDAITNVTANNRQTEVSRTLTSYFKNQASTHNLILPEKIESSHSGVSGLRRDIKFERYDQKGNIAHTLDLNGINTVYLWGYNGQYVIAKIQNATYSQVTAFINEASLNAIASKTEPSTSDMALINGLRANLPDALINTYTYKPLIGMISQADPTSRITYYEYDGWGRLILVKDDQGKVLKKVCYNYAGQEVDSP